MQLLLLLGCFLLCVNIIYLYTFFLLKLSKFKELLCINLTDSSSSLDVADFLYNICLIFYFSHDCIHGFILPLNMHVSMCVCVSERVVLHHEMTIIKKISACIKIKVIKKYIVALK